jgi:predicted lipoprotein with Yx(FWY)xxD motif
MPRPGNHGRRRRTVVVIGALAAFALVATASIAAAKSFTLKVTKNVHVDNTTLAKAGIPVVKQESKKESVVVGPTGFAVYMFKGESVKPRHLICTKSNVVMKTSCLTAWPQVVVASSKHLSLGPGVKGKLTTFKNHGVLQLALNNKPLYYFSLDIMSKKKTAASGDLLKTFGSTWNIVTP